MAGHHGKRGGHPPVSDGDAGRRGYRNRRADAGHHLPRHPCAGARQNLLATAPEHEGIAALEADDEAPRLSVVDQDGVDGRLLEAVPPRRLAREDPERALGRLVEQLGGREPIVDDHLGATEPSEAAERHEFRVARTGADQDDAPPSLLYSRTRVPRPTRPLTLSLSPLGRGDRNGSLSLGEGEGR